MAKQVTLTPKKSILGIISFPFKFLLGVIKNAFYDISVIITRFFRKITKADKRLKVRSTRSRKIGEAAFCYLIVLYPVVQFLVCYVSVNFNSILLSFKRYDNSVQDFVWRTNDLFKNFKAFFQSLSSEAGTGLKPVMIKNSFIAWGATTFIGLPLNVIFAYVIYKKVPCTGFFQIVLYLPQMVSGLVVSILFYNFVGSSLPIFMQDLLGVETFPDNPFLPINDGAFGINIFYIIWVGFGTQLILYANAMSRIPDSIIEYGELEGISHFKEFTKVVLPMIYSTITVFLVTGVASIFTNQLALYNFYSGSADATLQTIGYYIYAQVVGSGGNAAGGSGRQLYYPEAAAAGLLFTLIVAPITLTAKYLLEKFGPNVEF